MNLLLATAVRNKFQQLYGVQPLVARAPGRVNIIGEHTDYNNGFVLPAAINRAVYVGVSRREDEMIHLFAEEFSDSFEVQLNEIVPVSHHWANYILGVVDQLKKRGCRLAGFNLLIHGDIPLGAGLSSSAAVECATAFALNEVFQLNLSKEDIVQIAQKAEHEFAGVQCGIMDMFASVYGKKDHVIRLDCRSLEYRYEPLRLDGYKIVLLNTNIKHSLAASEYNTRRQECFNGVELLQNNGQQVNSLREADLDMLQKFVEPVDPVVYRRCKYVVEENQRLLDACLALERGDLPAVGKLMYASHGGLRNEYEVSCSELDFLVETVRNEDAVIGARMMGGGFGGCTINIMKQQGMEQLVEKIAGEYQKNMGRELTVYVAETDDGAGII